MAARCSWCNRDADEAAKHFEGPHLTWCVYYRVPALPPGARREGNRIVIDAPESPPPLAGRMKPP